MHRTTLYGCCNRNGNSRRSLPHNGHDGYSKFSEIPSPGSFKVICLSKVCTLDACGESAFLCNGGSADGPFRPYATKRWQSSAACVPSLGQRIQTCASYRKRLLALPSWFIISFSINSKPRSPLLAWRR